MTSIELTEEEGTETGEHVELSVGKRQLFVTAVDDTTAVVLADEQAEKQSSTVVEDETWVTR